MGHAWIEDSKRPGGVGRAERERAFWERVASGRSSSARAKSRGRTARDAPAAGTASIRRVAGRGEPVQDEPVRGEPVPGEGRWESAYLAIVTMLTVVIFGLGWVGYELDRAPVGGDAKRYDGSLRDSGSPATFLVQTGRARAD